MAKNNAMIKNWTIVKAKDLDDYPYMFIKGNVYGLEGEEDGTLIITTRVRGGGDGFIETEDTIYHL